MGKKNNKSVESVKSVEFKEPSMESINITTDDTSSEEEPAQEPIQETVKEVKEEKTQKKKKIMTPAQLEHLAKIRQLAIDKKKALAQANPKNIRKEVNNQILEQAKQINEIKSIQQPQPQAQAQALTKDAKYYKQKYDKLKQEHRSLQSTFNTNQVTMQHKIRQQADNRILRDLEREHLKLSAKSLFGHCDFL